MMNLTKALPIQLKMSSIISTLNCFRYHSLPCHLILGIFSTRWRNFSGYCCFAHVTACQAERSFSSLCRLNTWLQNTMRQLRLNSVAICHVLTYVHKYWLQQIEVQGITPGFINRTETHHDVFGGKHCICTCKATFTLYFMGIFV